MNKENIKIIIRKDWKELLKSKQALLPMILVPLIFVIVFPVLSSVLFYAGGDMEIDQDVEKLVAQLPLNIFPEDITIQQKFYYYMLVNMYAPLFLIIPIMLSSVIAANSFAGEKERRTIEGLLYTPVTDQELVLGKILVSYLPAVAISWLSVTLYCLLANILSYPTFNRILLPTPTWLLLAIWLIPTLSFMSLVITIYVSQKAKSVWEAQQMSAFLVLPIIVVVVSQLAGVLYFGPVVVFIAGAIFFTIDIFLYKLVVKRFNRETMVSKLV